MNTFKITNFLQVLKPYNVLCRLLNKVKRFFLISLDNISFTGLKRNFHSFPIEGVILTR